MATENDKPKEKKVPVEMILEAGSERPPDMFKPYGEEMTLEGKAGQQQEEQQPRDRTEKPRSRRIYGKPSGKNIVPEEYIEGEDFNPKNLTQKEIKSARDAALKKIEEERKKRFEERQKKLIKINKKRLESMKEIKEKMGKRLKEKAVLEKSLKRRRAMRLAKRFQMDAKQGTSLAITAMFIIILGVALINDLSDMVLEFVGVAITSTGVGLVVLAVFESIIKIVDVATTAILVLFTIYVGGATRCDSKQRFMMLARILIAFGIEAVPFLGLITSWTITTLWNWHDVRRRAHEAEAIEQKIMEG